MVAQLLGACVRAPNGIEVKTNLVVTHQKLRLHEIAAANNLFKLDQPFHFFGFGLLGGIIPLHPPPSLSPPSPPLLALLLLGLHKTR